MQVLEEIRKTAGDDFIVGLRLLVDDRSWGGFDKTEGFEIIRRFWCSAHDALTDEFLVRMTSKISHLTVLRARYSPKLFRRLEEEKDIAR